MQAEHQAYGGSWSSTFRAGRNGWSSRHDQQHHKAVLGREFRSFGRSGILKEVSFAHTGLVWFLGSLPRAALRLPCAIICQAFSLFSLGLPRSGSVSRWKPRHGFSERRRGGRGLRSQQSLEFLNRHPASRTIAAIVKASTGLLRGMTAERSLRHEDVFALAISVNPALPGPSPPADD